MDFDKNGGLVTVVTQDAASGMVLMVAHADREAVERTLATGEMHYFSRTRGLWHKGATSGNMQRVVSLACDCDGDACSRAWSPTVRRAIPARCRASWVRSPWATRSPRSMPRSPAGRRTRMWTTTTRRMRRRPRTRAWKQSYTVQLLEDRNLRLKKLGEEAAELIAACADGDLPRATEEVADLLYHALVALRAAGGSLSDVQRVLAKRATPAMPPRAEEKKDDPKKKRR